jgi:hypothetical protein
MSLRPPDAERQAALRGMKLRALVRDTFGVDDATPSPFGMGAALQDGRRGWVLVEDSPRRGLGPAMAWARTHEVDQLHLLVEDDADELARRAEPFDPSPAVWAIEGRDLVEAVALGHVEGANDAPDVTPDVLALLESADVDVVREHGQLTGEVLGLEIARLVLDPDFGPRLEVGVGRHDREAFAMLHGDLPPDAAVAKVVDAVRQQRQVGAAPHPLNRLASERWLRALLLAEPGLVGATHLTSVAPVWPRTSVKDVVPASAVGEDAAGNPLVVVTSTGIDLDLVPEAADVRAREWLDPGDGRLVLVLPDRDAHPVTLGLAEQLHFPAEVVALPGDWRGLRP